MNRRELITMAVGLVAGMVVPLHAERDEMHWQDVRPQGDPISFRRWYNVLRQRGFSHDHAYVETLWAKGKIRAGMKPHTAATWILFRQLVPDNPDVASQTLWGYAQWRAFRLIGEVNE